MSAELIGIATIYLRKFPFDCGEYPVTDFDKFMSSRALPRIHRLPTLVDGYEYGPRHPEWGSHLDRRHDLKKKLNRGGGLLEPEDRFYIGVVGNNRIDGPTWKTYRLVEATTRTGRRLADQINTTLKTKFRNVTNLMNSMAWEYLSTQSQISFNEFDRTLRRHRRYFTGIVQMLEEEADYKFALATAELLRLQDRGELPESLRDEIGFLLNDARMVEQGRQLMLPLRRRRS